MKVKRKKTRQIMVGNITVGGDAPVRVQTMTCTDTRDVESTLEQINRVIDDGAEIVRVAVPDDEAAESLKEIVKYSKVPIIADIHFNYVLAVKSIENGAGAIRINPGNISDKEKLKKIIDSAKANNRSIRIGVNSGSVEKELLDKYGYPSADAMVESALNHVRFFEDNNFDQIKISIKSSDTLTTIEANRKLSEKVNYPIHLGVTEAGPIPEGIVKSSVGIGALLLEGIGDTIRVSLTDDPAEEVKIGYEILKSLKIRDKGINFISCPTCGRIEIDVIGLMKKVKEKLKNVDYPLTVSILGCVVNGPGEAAEADVALAGGKHVGILYVDGKMKRKVKEEDMLEELYKEVIAYVERKKGKAAGER